MPTGYRTNGQIKPGTRIIAECSECEHTGDLEQYKSAANDLGAIRATWGTVSQHGETGIFAFEVVDMDDFRARISANPDNEFVAFCTWRVDVDTGSGRRSRPSDMLIKP